MNPAVLWRDGALTSLNDLPEVQAAGWWLLAARDINDHDQIVGIGSHGGLVKAFLLSPATLQPPFGLTTARDRTNLVVSFPTQECLSYHLQFKRSLADTNWSLLTTTTGNGTTQSFTDPMTNGAQFYRVVTLGGCYTSATGDYATALGYFSTASGDYSMAAGTRARAIHEGAFVWADSSEFVEFASTGTNQFSIRARGGVGINKNDPATALDVNGTVTATAFNPSSDRNLKEQFAPVNPVEMLAKVAALPISRWSFKGDTATPHVGPMAQDFHAAFALGTDDKHIATVDADGVALAAIQGLNQKVEDRVNALERDIKRRDAENAELKERLNKLEKLLENRR